MFDTSLKCHYYFSGKRADQKDSPDWAPSVNMSVTEIKEKQVHKLLPRFRRRQQRTEKAKECAAAKSLFNLQDTTIEEPEQETGEQSQTDLTSHFIDSMTSELQT